jgi:probable HAF family extracellular repeat protein
MPGRLVDLQPYTPLARAWSARWPRLADGYGSMNSNVSRKATKMNRRKIALLAALSAGAPMLSAQAQTAKFHLKQLLVAGDDNVQATAINDSGVIVGTVYAGITDVGTGIEIVGNKITTLPAPSTVFTAFNPRAINAAGDIFGWGRNPGLGNAQSFLLQGGTYNTAYEQNVILPSNIAAHVVPQVMGLTDSDEIFFNTITSLSGPLLTQYGIPPNFMSAPPGNRYTLIQSINNAGTIAGTAFSFSGIRTMFEGQGTNFNAVLPPGSINTLGGFLNNTGAIAGSYVDASHVYHGFVYQSGTYTTFDMPVAASEVSVTGINDSGRVVGYYTSGKKPKIHAFLYNGTTVSTFGVFPQFNNVNVVINNSGVMAVSSQWPDLGNGPNNKYVSYRVTCSGAGC